MSGRQYGIQPGYREGGSIYSTAPVSPMSAHNAHQSRSVRNYGHQQPPSGRVSPVDRSRGSPYQPRVHTSAPPAPPQQAAPLAPTRSRHHSTMTADEDNYGAVAAGGGITGFATGLTNAHPRESGVQALRDIDNLYGGRMMSPSPEPPEGPHDRPPPPSFTSFRAQTQQGHEHEHTNSQNSIAPLMAHQSSVPTLPPSPPRISRKSVPAGAAGAGVYDSHMPRQQSYHGDGYDDFDPRDIDDDGDDGLQSPPRQRNGGFRPAAATGARPGAAAGEAGMLKSLGTRDASGNYGPVPGEGNNGDPEKSEWLQHQSSGNKKLKWIVGGVIAFLIVAGIVGGVVGGVLSKKNSSSSTSSGSSSSTSDSGDLYDINSSQVKALLNNKDLHRVFPGMDYTPLNAQYPDCLSNAPDQNNVTLDIAMLAQLTPAVRLYGTDCNQTEMVLAAIDRMGYNDTLKVWLGVWLGNNATTNSRQLDQMYSILSTYPSSHFAGIIVGNEVLFRKDLTITQLGDTLTSIRSNLTSRGIELPVASSDLGDDWTAGLAADSDIVMANVHPFFAGVTPDAAPGWTWSFWQTHDAALATAKAGAAYPKSIISEVGWPSQGGKECGTESGCSSSTAGAVASIDNMNALMEGWVCPSMANGTTYFWFEAFDEPWKVIFDTNSDKWESQWGLMDANRNVKPGLKIPDCGGKTVDKPY